MRKLLQHISEYVARYSVLAIAVLTPASALLGTLAADLGGINTSLGKALLGVSAGLGTAVAGIVFIRNLGIWQVLERFGSITSLGDLFKPAPKIVVQPAVPAPVAADPKPHKPVAPPPVIPPAPPVPAPQPMPTHPPPKKSPISRFTDALKKARP